ncbi:IclR family transcriptional regulator C-terminal domain-containing protein [Streptomyces sp. NPDC056492]|uniref:IclR family transcriptional regulator domain-containing protein n=1 Tax=unclassified Streptomyces TaxID=2593676 RepID=UPI0036AA86FF
MIRNDSGRAALKPGSTRTATTHPSGSTPREYWDRPDGDWGPLASSDALDRREHANSCYRMGSKALRRGDGHMAVTWLTNACMELHPGAAFRLAVALWRPAYDRGRAAEVREQVLGVLDAAVRFGHADAQVLLDLYTRSEPQEYGFQPTDWQDPEFVPAVIQLLNSYLVPGAVPTLLPARVPAPAPQPAEGQRDGLQGPQETGRFSPNALRSARVADASQQMQKPLGPQRWESAMRVLDVLDVIASAGRPVDSERIRTRTSLPHLVLEQLLFWLCAQGLAERLADGSYVPGPLMKTMSADCSPHRPEATLQRALARLRDTAGAAVYLSTYAEGEVSITHYADGPSAPMVDEWVDFKDAAHASAVGKSLLHQLDFDSRMDHLSRRKAVRLTPRTITDPSTLFRAIDHYGPQALQFDLLEYSGKEVCVAVPLGIGGQAGCVALSLPYSQRHRLVEIARILSDQATGLLLSLLLAADPPNIEYGRQGSPDTRLHHPTAPDPDPAAQTATAIHDPAATEPEDLSRLWLPASAHHPQPPENETGEPPEPDQESEHATNTQGQRAGIRFGRYGRSLTADLVEPSSLRTRHLHDCAT